MAGLTSFFLALGSIYFGLDFALPQAQAAPTPTARLIQVLGQFDKFFTGNGTDSELRLDFVIEVPAGSIQANGTGLALLYDYAGTYTGPVGTGIQASNQGKGGTWYNAGTRITTPNLAVGDVNQQYRIIRIDNFGTVDRVTLSIQGDLASNFDATNSTGTGATYSLPVTVQAGVTVGSTTQYLSYQYLSTMFNVSNTYSSAFINQKISPVLPYDNIYGAPVNSQTNWGYVVNDTNPVVPAGRMYVSFLSPWRDSTGTNPATSARAAGVCTEADSFYYQWIRRDGTATVITPNPVQKTIAPMAQWGEWGAGIGNGKVVDLGPIDFTAEGPGYYQLVAWPIATNPSLADPTSCSDYSYYINSVGDLTAKNAMTMGSVFYTGGSMAVGVNKTFDENPMAYQGTSSAIFTLDSEGSRISGVGFTDTFPSNLYLTGNIIQDTCDLQSQSVTAAQLSTITSSDILSNVEPGPLLMLKDADSDGKLDTVKVQGGVSYSLQSGDGEVIGTTVPLHSTCVIEVEVKHTDTITGNSVCPTTTTPVTQTNDATNVPYQSMSVVLAYDPTTGDDEFGECLSITMQTDMSPTGATTNVLAGTTIPLSTVVTSSAGPSPIDTAPVVITAPTGTTLTNVTPSVVAASCSLNPTNTVANCTTGPMNPGDTVTYNYSVVVPSTVTSASILNGTVATPYQYDTDTTNNSQPITLTVTAIDSANSTFTVSSDDIVADGTATGTITATLADSSGTPVPGMSSVILATLATPDSATTFSNFTETSTPGTYTATVSSTSIGNKQVVVTAQAVSLTASGNDIAHFVAGALSTTNSTFTVSPVADPTDTTSQTNWQTANGTGSYTGTLTARDASNLPITTLDLSTINFTSTSSDVTVSAVTDQGNGVYTVTYTSLVADSSAKALLSVGATALAPTAGLPTPFKAGPAVPGPVVCADSSKQGTNLSVSATNVSVGGTSTGTALITDANCNPVPNATVNFSIETGTAGVLSIVSATTDANGIATATVTDNAAETVTLHAQLGTVDITGSPQNITFIAGAPDPDQSFLALSTTTRAVGQTISATVTVEDSIGNLLSGKEVTVTLDGDATVGAVGSPKVQTGTCITDTTGMCSVAFTDPSAETVNVTAQVMVGSTPSPVSGSPAAATFTAGPLAPTCTDPNDPTAEQTNVTVNLASLPVGQSSTVRAYVTDQFCNPIDGATVSFSVDGSATLGDATKTTVAGVAMSSLTDDVHEIVEVTVQVGTQQLPGSPVEVEFLAGVVDPGMSMFAITPDGPVVADGNDKYTAVFTAKDSMGNTLDALDLSDIVFGASSGSVAVSNVVNTGSGTYTVFYTSTVASDAYTATLYYKTSQIRGEAPIPFKAGAVSAASAFTVSPSVQTAGVSVTVSITALDAEGNPVNGLAQGDFQISSTNDKSAPDLVLGAFTALGNGVYTWTTTSTTAATFTLTGVVGGVTLTAQPTAQFTAAGVSASTSSFVVTANDQLADGTSQDTATAYAKDQYGNPVANAQVSTVDMTTGANAGILNPTSGTCVTGTDGTCALAWTASSVGSYVVQGTIGSLSPSDGSGAMDIRFSVGNINAANSDLVVTPTSLLVDGLATAKVTVRDSNGISIPGAVVSFSLETALSGTGSPSLSATTCTTDSTGACSVVVTSRLAGDVKVHATVPEGGLPTDVGGYGEPLHGSPVTVTFNPKPVCFTGCNPVDPTHVTRVEVSTNGVAANGTAQDVATAYAYDTNGNPVSGIQVQTSSTDSTLNIVTVSTTTGADGTATLPYTSLVAGAHNANVTIASQTPTGSPVSLSFSPGTADPARSYLEVTPDPGPIQVDQTYTITVHANDATNNPVTGSFVAFQIPGNVTASSPTCTTVAGTCSITVTSTVAGSYQVGAQVAAGVISNSPVTVDFIAGPVCIEADGCVKDPGVDNAHTTRVELTVNGQPADGVTPDVAVAYAFDQHGNPVSGAVVASTSDPQVVIGTITPTHSDGSTTIQYASTIVGPHSADVTIDGGTPAGSPVSPEFAAQAGVAAESSWSMSPSGPLTVGTTSASTYTATMTIHDVNGNNVPGAVVTLNSVQSGVTFPAGATCTANGSGQCTVDVYSTVEGTFDFTALLGPDQIGLSDSRAWTPAGVCAAASGCNPLPGVDAAHTTRVEVTTNGAVADGVHRDVATVYAFDEYGNPVPGALVQSTSSDSALGIQTGIAVTDATGVSTIWYSSTVSGDHNALVTVGGVIPDNGVDSTGSVTVNFVPGPVSAANSTLAVDSNSVPAGDTVTATATTRDAYNNLVPGVVVSFGKTGSAALLGGSSCTTDATGTCTVRVLDIIAEPVDVSATIMAGGVATPIQGSPQTVTFTAGALDPSASSFTVAPAGPLVADGVAAYTGTFIPRDSYGNLASVPNVPGIVFGSSSTDVTASPVVDNGDGTYSVVYTTIVASNDYTATLNYETSKIGADEPIPFIAGAPVAANSSLDVDPPSVTVGGSSTATVTLRDANNNLVGGGTADLAVTGSASLSGISCTTNNVSGSSDFGTCQVTLTDNTAETVTVTATLGGATIPAPTDVTFGVGAVSAASGFTVSPTVQTVGVPVTLTVSAQDGLGNPINGLTSDKFQISSTNDKGLPELSYGVFTPLGNGQYSFTTTSTAVGTYTFTAVVDGVTLTAKPAATFVSAGVSASTSGFVLTLNDQLANGVSQDTATAYAKDQYGNPVAGASVLVADKTTGVNAGELTPDPATCVTGTDGTCALAWTAGAVGAYVGEGTISGLFPDDGSGALDIRFTVGNISAARSDLVVTPASLTVGSTATATVTIRDGNGILVPGGVASFSLETVLSGTGAPTLSAVTCTTDASGTCSVSVSSLLAGDVKVHATVSEDGTATEVGGNGDPVKGSPALVTFTPGPVCFTACSPVDPTHVTHVEVTTNGVAADGTAQDIATAYAYDANGNPVSGVAVATSTADAELNIVSASATTGADGKATLAYTSTVAAPHDADVTIAGVTPTGSPVTVVFGPGTGNPAHSTLSVSPDPGPIEVDQSYTITAHVNDVNDNEVNGAFVAFQIPGDVSASAPTCITDTTGTCSITVTSTVAGSYQVGAQMATGVISNSPVTVDFTAGPVCSTVDGCVKDPGVDDAHTTRVVLMVNGQHANGTSADVAAAYAFDKHGNPIQGAVVASTSDPTVVVGTITPTGADGSTTIQYTSTDAGVHTADVTVGGVTPVGSPLSPAFSAEAGVAADSSWTMTPGGPLTVGTGSSSTYTATMTIHDGYGNEVPGAVVTLASVQPGVTFPAGATCTTDSTGVCTVDVYSTVAGTFDFTALLGPDQIGVSQSRAWSPDVVCAVASACTPQPGVDAAHTTRVEVTANNVDADGSQHDVATVYAFDQYGNPVPNALVQSTSTDLDLTIQPGVIQTNGSGVATVWYASTVAGDYDALVTVGGAIPDNGVDATGSVALSFLAGPVSAANSTLEVDTNSASVGGTVTATATTRDANNNLVSGVVVSLGATGSGSLSNPSCTTDSTGTCTVTLTDSVAEPVQVSATVLDAGVATPIQGSPQTVTFGVGAVSDASAFTVSPTVQTVGVPVTLTLTVEDVLGNPINGLTQDKFVLSSTNDKGAPELVYGAFTPLANGVYTFTTTSQKVGNFTFTAEVDGVTLTAQPSTLFTSAGVSASTSGFVVTLNDQLADGTSQDTATASAKDQYGNPVSGAQVSVVDKTTGANAGVLNPDPATCVTDDTGSCGLAWSATSVGAYIGEGTIASLSPADGSGILDIRFSVGNISAAKSELVVTPTSLTVGGTATATVTVHDVNGILVPGAVASFSLETGLTGTGAPSLSSVTCTTDASGTCSVTVSSLLAGDVKVHATVPVLGSATEVGGNGDPLKGSPTTVTFTAGPVCFTGCSPIDPTHVTHVEVTTNGVAADGTAQDVATAYAYDTNGNPVSGVAVVTSTTDTDLDIVAASATTGADGTATLAYTSTKAGGHDADVTIASQTPAGSPVTVFFGPGTAVPAHSTLSVSPAGPIQVDQTYTITANVDDVNDNPVTGAFVAFQIPGNVTASAPTCITDASGTCTITVTSSVAGSYQVGAQLAGGALSNSPVTVAFTAGPVCIESDGCVKDPGVDTAHSTRVELTVNGQPSDGVSPDVAVAYAFDKHGNPVSGAVVSSTSTPDVVVGTIAPTGTDGSTTIQYTSTIAGPHTADVTIDGGTPTGSPLTPAFSPEGALASHSDWDIAPAGPLTVGTGSASTYTATMTVRDVHDNPVPGAVVTVASVQSGVTFPAGATCTTNALGVCTVDVYSTVAGTFDFTAMLGPDQIGVSESRAWAPDGVCAVASGCTPQAGVDAAHTTRVAVTTNNANADGSQQDVATVYAFDQYGNPVPGALVQSTSADPDLTIQPGIILTNASGAATIWYASTAGGNHSALVTVGGVVPDNGVDNTGMVTLTFADVTAPGAPTIDSPTDGDLTNDDPLTVEGTAEPGSTVEVVDETGTTVCTATADASGHWTCPVTLTDGDHTLTASATDAAGNKSVDSAPVDVTTDTDAPSAPTVDTANAIEVAGGPGSAEPGSEITVTWPDGSTGTTTVDPDGSWSIPTPPGMTPGEISVTTTDPAGNTSPETKKDLDTTAPGAPTVDKANATEVAGGPGSSEPGATITVTWPDGSTGTTTVNPDGSWSIPTPPGMTPGEISVTATDPAGNTSPETKKDLDTTAPGAPTVDKANATEVAGNPGASEPGATITVTWPDGSTGTTTVDPDGSWSIPTPAGMTPGEISVTATDPAGNTSPETKKNLDTTAPAAPRVDTADDTVVSGGAGASEPGATITVTWPDGTTDTTTVGPDGSWSIPTPAGMGPGEISVTATDPAGNVSPETKKDLDTTAPAAPTVDTANATEVAGNPGSSEPGATITVTWPDGTTDTTTVGPDGSWSIPTPPGMGSGEISVTATDPAGNLSPETKKDLDTIPPSTPLIDEANGTHVSGTGEPDSKITVTWPDATTSVTTVNPDGSWSIPTPPGMGSGQITAQAEDQAGNKSATVTGALDTSAPGAPVVNPSNGTFVTGQAEPGSTITIVDEVGNPVVCQEGKVVAGTDGGFICTPVTPLAPGTIISVVATDKAGNASPPRLEEIGDLGIRADFPVREAGQKQIVIGTGFIPGETVTLDFCSTCTCLGTGIADATGTVIIEFDIPEGTHPGSHIVRLTGDQSVKYMGSVETTFVVEAEVNTGGSVMIGGGASGAASAMLLLGWSVDIIPNPLRRKEVGA